MSEETRIITLRKAEWDLASSDELGRLLEPALRQPSVVLDLSKVTYMDSSCLTKLIVTYKRRAAAGFEPARLVIGNSSIRRLFQIAGLGGLWPTFDTLEAALAK